MLIEYIEFHVDGGDTVLIKKDSIKYVKKLDDKRTEINNDVVKCPYETVKKLLQSDPRRFICPHDIDSRIWQLKMLTLAEIIKRFPGWEAVNFIRGLLDCDTDKQISEYVHGKWGNDSDPV